MGQPLARSPFLGRSRSNERQYDQTVKYATALRLGTAEAEQVPRPRTSVAASGVPQGGRLRQAVRADTHAPAR
ncbi:hypothetical protein [Nonomuraea sp. NPDC049158]|uniref:hypothetical protein n=1 Tax=Nonomuraea sp. NPDC049158 TaxID=3155649 RepID=UPI0033CC7A92